MNNDTGAEKLIALITNGCRFAGPAALLGLKHLNCRIYIHDQSFSDDVRLEAISLQGQVTRLMERHRDILPTLLLKVFMVMDHGVSDIGPEE